MLVYNKSLLSESFLKNILNRFYRGYNFKKRLKHDPIEFPHRYSTPEDIEIAGFIASCFAYGKVELFKPVIEKILIHGNRHPANFFKNFALKKDSKYFKGISYRFNKKKDILCLIYMLSKTLKKWGSLKNLFYQYYKPEQDDIGEALNNLVDFFLKIDTSAIYGRNIKPYGLTQFFPSPEKGSACKRMNLFLRWMVRTKDIDFGIWDKVPPSKLIIPLDTHIAKISRCLDLTKRISSDWKTAKEITESLKKLDPQDPLKYDFALCHYGISGLCKGRKSINTCQTCAFFSI
ncbi:MAG: TIGR02757 family protein [Thermodesulfovibrionia bacterium]|nr:TIGR02757 family protein [Thermodesulfovibrionia bacterium]